VYVTRDHSPRNDVYLFFFCRVRVVYLTMYRRRAQCYYDLGGILRSYIVRWWICGAAHYFQLLYCTNIATTTTAAYLLTSTFFLPATRMDLSEWPWAGFFRRSLQEVVGEKGLAYICCRHSIKWDFCFFRTGTAASAHCCRRSWVSVLSLRMAIYIYGTFAGTQGRSVGRMQRACLFTWPAVTLKKNVEECMYVEASCDNLKKSRNLHSFFLSFFLSFSISGQVTWTNKCYSGTYFFVLRAE
jgi:hypothetical protein